MIDAAGEGIVMDGAPATLEPGEQACPYISCELKLNWLSGLLLHDECPAPDIGPGYEIPDLDFHQVAAA